MQRAVVAENAGNEEVGLFILLRTDLDQRHGQLSANAARGCLTSGTAKIADLQRLLADRNLAECVAPFGVRNRDNVDAGEGAKAAIRYRSLPRSRLAQMCRSISSPGRLVFYGGDCLATNRTVLTISSTRPGEASACRRPPSMIAVISRALVSSSRAGRLGFMAASSSATTL